MTDDKLKKRKPRKSDGTIYVCKCECGGNVRGTWGFGQLWTYCEKCTPVQTIRVNRKGVPVCLEATS